MELNQYELLFKKFPFLSFINYAGEEYVGVIQNMDKNTVSFYDYGSVRTQDEKYEFIELGSDWWNESSRVVPINVFLRLEWAKFKYTLKIFNAKDVKILFGQGNNLLDLATKRSKKRSITLIKRVNR